MTLKPGRGDGPPYLSVTKWLYLDEVKAPLQQSQRHVPPGEGVDDWIAKRGPSAYARVVFRDSLGSTQLLSFIMNL